MGAAALGLSLVTAHASDARAAEEVKVETKNDKAFVEGVIKEYFQKNPDVVFNALVAYQQKQEEEKQKTAQEKVQQHEDKLYDLDLTPAIGNVDGADATVVEFFDYSCGYCRRSFPILQQLVKDDPKVRVLFKEFPILGKASEEASKAAVAVFITQPKKYFDAHQLFMTQRLRDKEAILKALEGIGVDAKAVEKAMDGEEVAKVLESADAVARSIGVNGTPAFIVNGQFVGGALSLDTFKQMIADARAKKAK